jgi:hypothetical protein
MDGLRKKGRTLTPAPTATQARTHETKEAGERSKTNDDENRHQARRARGKKPQDGRRKQWRPHEGGKKKDGIEGIHRTCSANRNSHETTIHTTNMARETRDEMHQHIHINRSINQERLGTWDLKLGKS